MSYNPITDLLALFRQTSGGMRGVRVPGLDYLIAGLGRGGLYALSVGQAAPAINQATTVWFKPASPNSWVAEGAVFLFNAATGVYEPATPALWAALFAASLAVSLFQAVTNPTGVVNSATTLLAVRRAAPVTTALTLPSVTARGGKALQLVDWSTAVTAHEIDLTPAGGETIMQLATFKLFSTADQLSGLTLYPSTDLAGWVIAP